MLAAAPQANEPGFTLAVSGQIDQPPGTLGWSDLQQLAQTHVLTVNPQNPDRKTPVDFRGVLVRDLLAKFGAREEATEATVVSTDGFRATVQIADAKQFRMLLAIEADKAAIPRSSGGPIFLVHPFSENGPELKWKYPDRFWAFYVTNLIIGTEAPTLAVRGNGNDFHLNREALDQVDHATMNVPVSWKVEWPSGDVHLRGLKLQAVFDSVNVRLPDTGRIIVRGKSPLHRDPIKPIVIDVADLERCKPLLAMQWGPLEKGITARQGGPIALAFAGCADKYPERTWATFVEELELVTEEPAP